jgi:hypothetical protein
MTQTQKRPPMMKAARKFLAGLQLPDPPKHGPNSNADISAFLSTMLLFASGLKEDSATATCDPSIAQLSEVLHCSTSTVKRKIAEAEAAGILSSRFRGSHLSSLYTIRQTPQTDQQLSPLSKPTADGASADEPRNSTPTEKSNGSNKKSIPRNGVTLSPEGSTVEPSGVDPSEKDPDSSTLASRQVNSEFRGLNSGSQTGQQLASSGTTSLDKNPLELRSLGEGPEKTEVPKESSGLVIRTKTLPECPACQLLSGHEPEDTTRGYCEKHDKPMFRLS